MPDTPRPPRHEIEILRPRFARFLKAVIEPAVHGDPTPLEVGAWQTDERFAIDKALHAEYTPVTIGHRWGPAWSTCWFRLRGKTPADPLARPLDLRFSSRTECTVWIDGEPRRGLDLNRDSIEIHRRDEHDEPIRVYVEAACNHPFGVSTFDWDTDDTHDRWRSDEPGQLLLAELAPRNEPVRRLASVYRFASRLLDELEPGSDEARRLHDTLAEATALIDDRDVPATADDARAIIERPFKRENTGPHAIGLAVGHAHIDTAWLWPLAETRRKVLRSWTNALGVLEHVPGSTFIASQALQYAWLEEDAPAVFDEIRARVAEKRWEPIGGMWIEPDCSVPAAESLIRQVLHADRYWRSRFGDEHGAQTVLYLPDTFGFPASLPDIMRACGLDTFITNKIAWNQCTPYTHSCFRWRGLGGQHALAHFTPNHDYNCTNSPKELRRTLENLRGGGGCETVYLHPYGFGDGGGGPTTEQAEILDLARGNLSLPNLRHGSFDQLRGIMGADDDTGTDVPTHDGELYLELHRGTLTTHAWLKRANRELEQALRLAEIAVFAGPEPAEPRLATTASDELDQAWKLLLLQQFHDILPGSSITPVYDDAREHIERIRSTASRLIQRGETRWLSSSAGGVAGGPPRADRTELSRTIFNPSSSPRSGVVECQDGHRWGNTAPAVGVAPLSNAAHPPPVELDPDTGTMRNSLLEARIDRAGRITLLKASEGPDLARSTPLNRLALYRDIPMNWDAWDIDAYTEDELVWTNDDHAESWRARTTDPLRVEIEVTRTIAGRGRITQVFRLDAGSPRIDVITEYQWDDKHRLLRAEMPTDIEAQKATYEIQAGFIERPTTRDTSHERMMFEVCAHRWMDLSGPLGTGPTAGLALLNNGRYGHGCRGGTMHLSLLRAPHHPDPTAGQDHGSVTYSLLPHAGDWRAADADREAEALNAPLRLLPGRIDAPWSPVEITGAPGQRLEIAALKPAHDDPAQLVLRLIETRGVAGTARVRWNLPIAGVVRTDALERALPVPLNHQDSLTRLDVGPHEIITLVAARSS